MNFTFQLRQEFGYDVNPSDPQLADKIAEKEKEHAKKAKEDKKKERAEKERAKREALEIELKEQTKDQS